MGTWLTYGEYRKGICLILPYNLSCFNFFIVLWNYCRKLNQVASNAYLQDFYDLVTVVIAWNIMHYTREVVAWFRNKMIDNSHREGCRRGQVVAWFRNKMIDNAQRQNDRAPWVVAWFRNKMIDNQPPARRVTKPLWLDLGIRWLTTVHSKSIIFGKLWLDLGIRWLTTLDKDFLRDSGCGLI